MSKQPAAAAAAASAASIFQPTEEDISKNMNLSSQPYGNVQLYLVSTQIKIDVTVDKRVAQQCLENPPVLSSHVAIEHKEHKEEETKIKIEGGNDKPRQQWPFLVPLTPVIEHAIQVKTEPKSNY